MKGLWQVDARSWDPEESTTNWEQGSPVQEGPKGKRRECSRPRFFENAMRGVQVADPSLGGRNDHQNELIPRTLLPQCLSSNDRVFVSSLDSV
jgi:hypothetical protein